MSRSHRRPTDYSRGSSPRIDRNLSVTEASFQNLGLNETAGAQYQSGPSSYLLPDQRSRRPSYPRSGLNSGYLQPDYVSSSYTRAASPASFSALENSTSFGTTLLDPSDYQLFSDTGTFSSRISPFSTSALGRTDMGYIERLLSHVITSDSFQQLSLSIRHNDKLPRHKLLWPIKIAFSAR